MVLICIMRLDGNICSYLKSKKYIGNSELSNSGYKEETRTHDFFHNFASGRKRTNTLQRIKNDEGEWMETNEEIQQVIESYFTKLFTAETVDGKISDREMVRKISARENEALLAEVTPEEVKEAIFSMHPDKAPGPDGLNPGFFQVFWNIVAKDVILFCHEFLRLGELPNEINHAVIRLIPKIKVPQYMTDLRPISLCNVLVRILSKLMVNRLKPCLQSVISEVQSAFVEGRLLTDNALIAFEVNHYMRRRTQGSKGLAG